MSAYTLKRRFWWDDGDENLVYFQIVDDNRNRLWESQWYDLRDLDVDAIREEVRYACERHDLSVDLSQEWHEWETK